MPENLKKLSVAFYRMSNGTEPVRVWLRELSPRDRKIVGKDIALVEYGWPIGMPTCRPLGAGLFEVRSNISDGRIARVLFCTTEQSLVLLHGFIKKSQQTPTSDLKLGRSRQKDVQ